MPQITLAVTDTDRRYGRLPHYHLTNGFIEENKNDGVTGTVWLQRPGLADPMLFDGAGSGPVRLVWSQSGTFNNDWLVVCNETLFRVTFGGVATALGAILGIDFPIVAGGIDKVIIVSSGSAFWFDGSAVTPVNMPDGQAVSSVAYINGYFLLAVRNTQTFYWIAPGGTDPDPLDFASAERNSDAIVSIKIQTDTIIFLKNTNEEYWYPTGNADAPFQRVSGRATNYGCIAQASAVLCGPALVWVTADYQVVASDGAPQVFSTPAMTEALRESAHFRAWYYMLDGHPFYVLTTETATFAVDLSNGSAPRFNSYGMDYWRAHLGSQNAGKILAGASDSNIVWQLSPDASSDIGEPVTRDITGYIENVGLPISCDSLSLCLDVGWSPTPGFAPKFQVRWSDDQGARWSSWKEKSLGDQGHYSKDITFRSLGLVVRPGRIFHFRMTDDARFRVSWVRINEA